jgi:hypothetical protein
MAPTIHRKLIESLIVNDQYQILNVLNDEWKMESGGTGEETPESSSFSQASPKPEPLNSEPRQRLSVLIRIRLLFQTRPAEIFSVPYFQIFQISEDHNFAC